MVMKKLREQAKIFLVIVIVCFVGLIVFEWGMDVTGLRQQPNVLGEVNGEKIMADQYSQALQNQIEARRQQGAVELTDQDITLLENQVWEGMIQEVLMRQEIERLGIAATDSEIVSTLKHNPPAIIRNNENFLTDGQFDMQKYLSALYDPRNVNNWLPIEQYLRSSIPYQKLQNQIVASVLVSPEEVRWDYIKSNEGASIKYVFFNPEDYRTDDLQIEESEIEAYYDENQDKYQESEKRKIDYLLFPITPTEFDSQAVRSDAEDLLQRIKDGEDFASLAETYSEDLGTQAKGGDLGFFGRGAMVESFDAAAFAAEVGEVVGPVVSQFGLHIIKVEEKKTEDGEEKVKASHILLKYVPSNQTRGDIRTGATLFAMDAIELGFEQAVAKDSLNSLTSPLFVPGGFIPGIGFANDISEFVFESEAGAIREEPFDTDQGFVVAKLSEIQARRIRPLEEIQSSIRSILQTQKLKEMARQKAEEARSKMITTADFEFVAEKDSLELKTQAFFSRNESIPRVGRDPNFMGNVFALNANEISDPVETVRGYYLIQLIEKAAIDESDFERQKPTLYEQLLSQKRQRAFVDWYADLKEKAEIEDRRRRS